MALVRILGAGESIGGKLTSTEINAIDANIEGALDKRAGQTDTLGSVVTQTGAGRLIPTYAAGANADTTYLVSGANALIDVSTLTADRIYTLSNTNAAAGDRIAIRNRHATYAVTVKNAAASTLIVLGPAGASGHESGWAELWFNGAAWELAKSAAQPALAPIDFTANTTWTVPRGWTLALVIACGGGGSGGGGGNQSADTNISGGGGGGGGALEITTPVVFIPGESIDIVIGGGGASAAAVADGNPGTASTVTRVTGSVLLATFAGAQGGSSGVSDHVRTASSMTRYLISPGGAPAGNGNDEAPDWLFSFDESSEDALCAQHGGRGTSAATTNRSGSNSPQGKSGGLGGSSGNPDSTWIGGGGGGGGGAGPYGNGGNAGSGGNASSVGANVAGTNGTSAAANSGAGGGGGGSAGAGVTAQAGGLSGAGGSGKVRIIPIR